MHEPASRLKRIIAFIIDSLIAGVSGFYATSYLVNLFFPNHPFNIFISFLIQSSLSVAYWVYLPMSFGATPGKKMMGLRIISIFTNEKISVGALVLRETIGKPISGLVFGIGFLSFFFNKEGRTWHDLMAKTRVIESE
jgi:uncharacterized RDD family membrane protein YckC